MKLVSGTMIWINLNLDERKHWDWEQKIVEKHPHIVGNVFQTYLVHRRKRDILDNPEFWFLRQSNVHGIVVAANVVYEDAIDHYPKIDGFVAEHFIPEVTVVEEDFTAINVESSKRRLDVLTFSGDKEVSFFTAVKDGLEILRICFRKTGKNREEATYIRWSIGKVKRALEQGDRRRMLKVAAALRWHTRFDNAVIENIASFVTARCLSDEFDSKCEPSDAM